MLGIGAMLHQLSGGSENDPSEFIGKIIEDIQISDNRLKIDFTDASKIDIWDDGQSCCESRYMTTDDDIKSIIGKTIVHIVSKGIEFELDSNDESHEIVFIEIMTNDGFITLVNHNEHNGYYGGFGLTITKRI